ncbi:hypothetical protein [Candidatus Tisiphia endosymbiont of Micropterix aruncella]|uniref:hypothetical protein n=1 Tax=Candidatus Tisiphia endosymbiont of Micropterix aruncella TaxID=3066271 RepID=UPI003AA98AA4
MGQCHSVKKSKRHELLEVLIIASLYIKIRLNRYISQIIWKLERKTKVERARHI